MIEEHLNLKKISKKLKRFLEGEGLEYCECFDEFKGRKRPYMNFRDFDKLIQDIGYQFSKEEVEELFNFIDSD